MHAARYAMNICSLNWHEFVGAYQVMDLSGITSVLIFCLFVFSRRAQQQTENELEIVQRDCRIWRKYVIGIMNKNWGMSSKQTEIDYGIYRA